MVKWCFCKLIGWRVYTLSVAKMCKTRSPVVVSVGRREEGWAFDGGPTPPLSLRRRAHAPTVVLPPHPVVAIVVCNHK